MTYLPEPEKLSGFRTTDGQVFDNIMTARAHQNELTFKEFLEKELSHDMVSFVYTFLTEHQERIEEYYYCLGGSEPVYMNES